MIGSAGLEGSGDTATLSFRRPPLSDQSARPVLLGIGDPVAGPLVGLFYDAPSTPEQLAAPIDLTPAHSHPCDNFRVVMKGELWVGKERYHHGEFRLQRSGRPYGRDGDAPDVEGNWRIIFFADRRGHRVRPTNPKLRSEYSTPEAFAATKERLGDLLPVVLPDDDDGVDGLVTTIDKPFSGLGHIDASFDEAEQWEAIDADRRVAVSLLGAHDVGPVVIVQRTPAGREATPEVRFGTEVFRCVIRGTARSGEHTFEMGDTSLRAADEVWQPVVAGPDGLDELIILGNRQGGAPQVPGGDPWAERLAAIQRDLETKLAAAAQ
jgi:hypothetical protein